MPAMSYTPRSYNDQSALTPGLHPAFLLAITDEPTPDTWQMYAKSPRMWRWHFAVWGDAGSVQTQRPERQSAPTSQTFSPAGRQNASKAYLWTTKLLGREIAPGESVDLDPMMPIPCQVEITRKNEYANITNVFSWTEGVSLLTPELRQGLQRFYDNQEPQQVSPPSPQSFRPAQPIAQPVAQPVAGRWGSPTPSPIQAQQAAPSKPWGA